MKTFWYHAKLFDQRECTEIMAYLSGKCDERLQDNPAPGKTSKVKLIKIRDVKSKIQHMLDFVDHCNKEFYGFDLYPEDPFGINLNYYNPGQEYEWHRDGTELGTMSDVKLTAIVNLSDGQFDGGDLEIFDGNPITIDALREPGVCVVFPSFLYHRVTPVTKGTRVSASIWYKGRNWR